MNELKQKLWVEKYRPKTIKDFIFQDKHQESLIKNILKDGVIPHLLLSGVQGSGKTSLSQIITSELNVSPIDLLTINASDENSVDVIRNKITEFISSFPDGQFKIVQLEEADYISQNGQGILRQMLEERADIARFILTCNYPHKIMPAIKSRCQHFHFKSPDKTAVTKKAIEILLQEKIKFEPNTLLKYIDVAYPDFRKIIQIIQQHSIDGVLLDPKDAESNDDYKFKILDLLEIDDWSGIRKIVCNQIIDEEVEDLYRFLYENLEKSKKFQTAADWEQGQLLIAEHLYKDAMCSDREINLAALFIRLGQI